jgi:type I restriction enzyme S subunit
MTRLGDLCEFRYGKSLPAQSRRDGPVPVYGSNGVVGWHDEAITSGKTIVIGRKGSIGEVNVSADSCWPIDTTYYIDANATEVDINWLSGALSSLRLSELNRAAAVPGLNRGDAYDKKLFVPRLDEQRRIAAILEKADTLRQERKRAIAMLDSLTQSVFREMFGDPIGNSIRWPEAKLGDRCFVGSSRRVFASEFVSDGVPFYRGTEVGKLAVGEKVRSDLHISPEHYHSLIQESGKPEVGDLLLPSICHDGRVWRVDRPGDFYFKDGRVLWIKLANSGFDGEYLREHLSDLFRRKYDAIASGTTFAELKITNLKNLLILAPPLHLQVEFSRRRSLIRLRQAAVRKALTAAQTLFSSLQHRAFAGQL